MILVNQEKKAAVELAKIFMKSGIKHGSVLMLSKEQIKVYDTVDFRIEWFPGEINDKGKL